MLEKTNTHFPTSSSAPYYWAFEKNTEIKLGLNSNIILISSIFEFLKILLFFSKTVLFGDPHPTSLMIDSIVSSHWKKKYIYFNVSICIHVLCVVLYSLPRKHVWDLTGWKRGFFCSFCCASGLLHDSLHHSIRVCQFSSHYTELWSEPFWKVFLLFFEKISTYYFSQEEET